MAKQCFPPFTSGIHHLPKQMGNLSLKNKSTLGSPFLVTPNLVQLTALLLQEQLDSVPSIGSTSLQVRRRQQWPQTWIQIWKWFTVQKNLKTTTLIPGVVHLNSPLLVRGSMVDLWANLLGSLLGLVMAQCHLRCLRSQESCVNVLNLLPFCVALKDCSWLRSFHSSVPDWKAPFGDRYLPKKSKQVEPGCSSEGEFLANTHGSKFSP